MATLDVEKFIECVKQYPILYDPRHKYFKNFAKKMAMWEVVAREMNESSEALRTKWKGLKDGYTKYKKQMGDSTCMGSAKAYINWVWGPNLEFLDRFLKKNRYKSHQSLAQATSSQQASDTFVSPSKSMSPVHFLLKDNDTEENKIEDVSPTEAPPTPITFISSRIQHRVPTPYRNRPKTQENKRIRHYMARKRVQSDAVDDLFMSYAKTFKQFSIQSQTMLKIEMAKLFAEVELREHINQALSPGYSVTMESERTEDNLTSYENLVKIEQDTNNEDN